MASAVPLRRGRAGDRVHRVEVRLQGLGPAPPQVTAWAIPLLLLGRGMGFPAALVEAEARTHWAVGIEAVILHPGGIATRAVALLAPAQVLRERVLSTELRVRGGPAFASELSARVRELVSTLEEGHKLMLVMGQARDDSALHLVAAALAVKRPKWMNGSPPVPGPEPFVRLASTAAPESIEAPEPRSLGPHVRYALVANDGVYTTVALVLSPEAAVEEVMLRVREAAEKGGGGRG